MRQRRGQLAGGAMSHEAPPLTCLLEDPSWRLAGSVEQPRRADGAVWGEGSGTSRRSWADSSARQRASLLEARLCRRPLGAGLDAVGWRL
jgi:hypothetical protein